jgi:hypothetical protein
VNDPRDDPTAPLLGVPGPPREEGVGWSKRARSRPEPIRIPCEGSGCPPNMVLTKGVGLCSMCGRTHALDGDGKVIAHDRDDVIAMIQRGDFG